jgi:hypothetical protein
VLANILRTAIESASIGVCSLACCARSGAFAAN